MKVKSLPTKKVILVIDGLVVTRWTTGRLKYERYFSAETNYTTTFITHQGVRSLIKED